uniref:Glutaredoxin domain-containing protein n=1 Tax=Strombidium rassoulzadegani TaxID=1082188 RepID=A0A7S3FTW7_9SPIT|mmetsp:Transcript_11734/g.19808  ORF Transcript_11734/g.19808 Transcript_11734/m.19808 type:complete len:110 (+) Transcript_11734:57-386(+)|eukprot:CAMPEP_0168613048 /NCGR_PEP_ID=MMETSP0449_2-20121227/3243_1 /TAXON_ID=1082188 /ORGANISM="Strombidium rassoulzadegani, Strain ras09" /LENGTH=109 /DNA_ID=CAMNT_0008653655 /DNA_START=65 /DNA_END=394 /DNA_ORIENTATION=+
MQGGDYATQVKELIDNNKVMMFSKGYCPFCDQAKAALKAVGVNYKVIEMDEMAGGDQMHQALKSIAKMNTVPCTYVGGKKVGGCDDLKAAIRSGSLKTMLNEAGVPNKM